MNITRAGEKCKDPKFVIYLVTHCPGGLDEPEAAAIWGVLKLDSQALGYQTFTWI